MKIHQILPTLAYGDAIGNHVMSLHRLLTDAGYESEIYAENIDRRMQARFVHTADQYDDRKTDLIIYHMSTGDPLNEKLLQWSTDVILVFHNITLPEYFESYDKKSAKLCSDGWRQLRMLASRPVACIADSEYNKTCLIESGFHCPVDVVPILIRFSDYEKNYNKEIVRRYADGKVKNLLFVGRIAPNKKIEDLIASFYCYHNFVNEHSRLILAGSFNEADLYYRKLQNYTRNLGLDSVLFTGHIPFTDLLAYYHLSDLFLCLSDHEGFCVPLVEAMYFYKPIVAYDSTAVGETLGEAGLLLKSKDPRQISEAINLMLTDVPLQRKMLANEEKRLQYYNNDKISKRLLEVIRKYIA